MLTTLAEPRRRPSAALVTLSGAAGAVTLAALAPSITRFGPVCPIHAMTGFDCPGCGVTRAVVALARGDLAAAFGHNAFFVASLPLLTVVWVSWFRASGAGVARPPWLRSTVPLTVWAGVGLAFAVVRNLPFAFFEALRA